MANKPSRPQATDPMLNNQQPAEVDAFLEEVGRVEATPPEEATTSEPTIVEEAPATSGAPTPSEPPTPEAAAAALQEKVTQLEATLEEMRRAPQPGAARVEPQIEYETVLGVPIPKDPAKQPIKVTSEDLLKMGWNEDPAKALNTLANAIFGHIARAVIPAAVVQSRAAVEAESGRTSQKATFEAAYPDLKDYNDLLEIVESQLWKTSDPRRQFSNMDDYRRHVAKEVRSKLARIRGQSLEEYEAGLSQPGTTNKPTTRGGRAVSTSTGVRSAVARPNLTNQQKEIADVIGG